VADADQYQSARNQSDAEFADRSLMKVIGNRQMPGGELSKLWSEIQMSQSQEPRKNKNTGDQSFQLPREYKLTKVMSNSEKPNC
jgi:hypothetical protein